MTNEDWYAMHGQAREVFARGRRHRIISYVKSAVRIAGGFAFIYGTLAESKLLWIAGSAAFIVAEIGGILEEVYGA